MNRRIDTGFVDPNSSEAAVITTNRNLAVQNQLNFFREIDPFSNKIFYNMYTTNTTNTVRSLYFDETITRDFLNGRSNEFQVGIVRFSIPTAGIPYFLMREGLEKVTIAHIFGGVDRHVTTDVLYIPISNIIDPTFPVYSIHQYMYMINVAILTCYQQLALIDASLPAVASLYDHAIPYLTYDTTNDKISITVPNVQLYSSENPNAIRLYFNNYLYSKIPSFDAYYDNTLVDYEFHLRFYPNSPLANPSNANFFVNTQETATYESLTDVKSIIFTTNLQISQEYFRAGDISTPVITDYILINPSVSEFHSSINYSAIVPYKTSQILNPMGLSYIRIDIAYINKLGQSIPIQIRPSSSASIKLMFECRKYAKY